MSFFSARRDRSFFCDILDESVWYADSVRAQYNKIYSKNVCSTNMKTNPPFAENRKLGKGNIMKRIFLLCLTALLLSACVPTPSEDVIYNKADGVLTERIAQKPVAEQRFSAPERVTETVEGRGVTVRLDADIALPTGGQYPVAEVVCRKYDAAWARDMLTRIASGRPLLVRESEAGANMTKDGILREIRAVQDDLDNFEEHFGSLPPREQAETRQALTESLEAWEAYYREAPENMDGLAADLSDTAFKARGGFDAEIDFTRPERAYHSPVSANCMGTVMLQNMEAGIPKRFSPIDAPLTGVSITEAEAVETARAFLRQLGETELEPVLTLAADCPQYGDDPGNEQAYALWFTRPVGDLSGAYADTQQDAYGQYTQNGGDTTYAAPCGQEYAYFLVRDSGVNWFEWHAPSTIMRTVNENVALLPFDEILAAFRKQIAWEVYPVLEEVRDEGFSGTIRIDRIALESVRVRKSGAADTYLLLPVWSFYGDLVLHKDGGAGERFTALRHYTIDANGDAVYRVPGGCYMQINAIDGSVYNPALGY